MKVVVKLIVGIVCVGLLLLFGFIDIISDKQREKMGIGPYRRGGVK